MLFSNKNLLINLTISFGMGLYGMTAFAGKVAAKKDGVKVYSKASKKSDVLKTLKKGEDIETKERKGMYWQVAVSSSQKGYVSVLKVKKTEKSASVLGAALKSAVEQGRDEDDSSNVRARSAVMGVRGLDETNSTANAGNVKPNLRMVYAMEDITLSAKDLDSLGDSVFAEIEKKVEN